MNEIRTAYRFIALDYSGFWIGCMWRKNKGRNYGFHYVAYWIKGGFEIFRWIDVEDGFSTQLSSVKIYNKELVQSIRKQWRSVKRSNTHDKKLQLFYTLEGLRCPDIV